MVGPFDFDNFETGLPNSSAIYYIIACSSPRRCVSIWDEKQGNTPDNSNMSRGEGSNVYLNTDWSTGDRDHDRWRISPTENIDTYNIESLCGKYAYIPVGPKDNEPVTLNSYKYSWEIRKDDNAHGSDEFYIVTTKNRQKAWSYNKWKENGIQLKINAPLTWKFVKYNPNSTDQNPPTQTFGRKPGLSFGIDIGTEYTSVSYLDPEGKIQQIKEWYKEFSGGGKDPGVSVLTRMYYDKERMTSKPRYCGPGEPPTSENSAYTKIYQFKKDMNILSRLEDGQNKNIRQHYKDWLEYLFNNVKHVQEVWPEHWAMRQVVIVVPNSWEFDQRIVLKEATFKAGWIINETNIKFVRECEATLHCLETNKALWKPQEVGKAFVILDAGHMNFDVALFYVKSTSPLKFREKAGKPPETVTRLGLQRNGMPAGPVNAESLHRGVVDRVIRIKRNEKNNLEYVYLAGNLDKNKRLLADLGKIGPGKLNIVSTGWQNAADGALHNSTVVAHAMPCSYGVETLVSFYDAKGDLEERSTVSCPNGEFYQFGWNPIINYEMVLEGRTTKSEDFSLVFEREDADLLNFDITIFTADKDADKDWTRDPQGNLNRGFRPLFSVKADLAKLKDKLVEEFDEYSYERYYRLNFGVVLVFDSINLEGYITHNKNKVGVLTTFELVKDDV